MMADDNNSGTKPLVSLCNDYDHYLRCIAEFDRSIPWLPDLKKWVNTHLGQRVLDRLSTALPDGEPLRVFGVGSGEGEVEYNLLSRLLTKYPKIHNTVVDPSKTQLVRYGNLIRERQSELAGVEYDWHVQTLTEYKLSCEESGDQTKFHVISALFCLYYEPDLDSSLAYLYSRLKPGGVLLTSLETERSDTIKIEERYQFAQDDLNPLFSTRDICAFFERHDIPHAVCPQPDDQRDFDITACFDDASKEGALLLDFLSSVLHFRESVSPAVFEEFRDYLRGLATFRDGKAYLYYDSDYILAWKK